MSAPPEASALQELPTRRMRRSWAWLDYSLLVIMGRLLRRTFRRALGHHELWSGNRESLRRAFFSRRSILLWALQTYRRRRREYPVRAILASACSCL